MNNISRLEKSSSIGVLDSKAVVVGSLVRIEVSNAVFGRIYSESEPVLCDVNGMKNHAERSSSFTTAGPLIVKIFKGLLDSKHQ